MKITIGGEDFTSALDAAHPLTIERKLNTPTICQLWITLPAADQAAITRNQSIKITGDDGIELERTLGHIEGGRLGDSQHWNGRPERWRIRDSASRQLLHAGN